MADLRKGDRIKWLRFDAKLQPYVACGTVEYADRHQIIARADGEKWPDNLAPDAARH